MRNLGRYCGFKAFETFRCPKEVHPLIFAQMCTLFHQSKGQNVQTGSHAPNSNQQISEIQATTSEINCNLIPKDLDSQDTILGQVWIGDPRKVICIPANSVKVIEGKTSKKAR